MPEISIIVPCYNVEKYIHQCVDSILAQDFTDFEVILVNDGSPDRCGEIADEYAAMDLRMIVIHRKNGGPATARNSGLEVATGKYLYFVDPDDYFGATDYLSRLYHEIDDNNVDMVITNYTILSLNRTLIERKPLPKDSVDGQSVGCAVHYMIRNDCFYTAPWSRIIRNNANVEKHILFDLDPQQRHAEDVELTVRLLPYINSIRALNYPKYVWRKQSKARQKSERWQRAYEYRCRLIEKHYTFLLNNTDMDEMLRKALLGYLANQWYFALGRVTRLPTKAERDEAMRRIVALKPITKYSLSRKARLARLIVTMFGVKLGAKLLSLYG